MVFCMFPHLNILCISSEKPHYTENDKGFIHDAQFLCQHIPDLKMVRVFSGPLGRPTCLVLIVGRVCTHAEIGYVC